MASRKKHPTAAVPSNLIPHKAFEAMRGRVRARTAESYPVDDLGELFSSVRELDNVLREWVEEIRDPRIAEIRATFHANLRRAIDSNHLLISAYLRSTGLV